MQILYDGQIYAIQANGGINRYFDNIISRLPENYSPTLTAIHQRSLKYPVHSKLKIYKYKRFRFPQLSSAIEKQYFRYLVARHKFDIIHPTNYFLLTQKEVQECSYPVVITIYDMIHELFAEQMDVKGETADAKKKAILAAQRIICISENTKKDLLERYAIPEEKISVTYLASEIDKNLSYGSEQVPSRPYYLYVGSRKNSYKNFDGLLFAFSKAVSVNPDMALCVVGSPFNDSEIKRINDLKLAENIEHYKFANDSHLAKLYRCSVAFVYPSLYEGFGIPPLEAMACGTAVVAANTSSIPEVVGNAGILFDPNATHDLADILLSLLDNQTERENLIAKGDRQVKMFSWDKTVAETIEVYRSVVYG